MSFFQKEKKTFAESRYKACPFYQKEKKRCKKPLERHFTIFNPLMPGGNKKVTHT